MSTIYDIAQKTGYSASTVSKALNGYENISETAKQKIKEVSKELNYIPNASARGLMTKKTFLIGLLIYEDQFQAMLHSHLGGILGAFKSYVEYRGYDVLFVNTKSNKNNHTYYEHCRYRSLDGILIAIGDIQKDEEVKKLEEVVNSEIPKVSIETLYENSVTVLSDNYNGAKKAMDYLFFLGHRKIGYVDIKYSGSACGERYRAYKEFLQDNNLKFDEEKVYLANGFKKEDGKATAKEILKKGFKNLPTAIFAICDEIAIGIIEGFRENGVRVPEDISIIGFDDIKVSEYVGLTTIRQNRTRIGELAAEKLIESIEGEIQSELLLIEADLVIRDTCQSIK